MNIRRLNRALLISVGIIIYINGGPGGSPLHATAMEMKVHKFNCLHHLYHQVREQSVRFLVRNHYAILKNDQFRNFANAIKSMYYESVYYYYKLSDDERDFIESITNLML
jgi:hypothetical protein